MSIAGEPKKRRFHIMRRRRFRSYKLLYLTVINTVLIIYILWGLFSWTLVLVPKLYYNDSADNITCYQENTNRVNGSERYESSYFAPDSIFFYNTDCERSLNFRAACAVEAACRLNKKRNVYVLFATKPDLNDAIMKELLKMKNLKIVKVDIAKKYALNTRFHDTLFLDTKNLGQREKRLYKITADFLKLMTLYENGGIVLDLDVVLTKPLKPLGSNWFLMDKDGFSMSGMRLSNNSFGKDIARSILAVYQKHETIGYQNAQNSIQHALDEKCHISKHKRLNITDETCKDLRIYNRSILEPFSFRESYLYFEIGFWNLRDYEVNTYGYHTWDIKTMHRTFSKDALFGVIANEYCPNLYATFLYEVISDYTND